MEQIQVREARSEVLIFLDRHLPDRLTALEEAVRILQREVIRERTNPNRNINWKSNDDIIQGGQGTDGQ